MFCLFIIRTRVEEENLGAPLWGQLAEVHRTIGALPS
jgi:hypothetical protein